MPAMVQSSNSFAPMLKSIYWGISPLRSGEGLAASILLAERSTPCYFEDSARLPNQHKPAATARTQLCWLMSWLRNCVPGEHQLQIPKDKYKVQFREDSDVIHK